VILDWSDLHSWQQVIETDCIYNDIQRLKIRPYGYNGGTFVLFLQDWWPGHAIFITQPLRSLNWGVSDRYKTEFHILYYTLENLNSSSKGNLINHSCLWLKVFFYSVYKKVIWLLTLAILGPFLNLIITLIKYVHYWHKLVKLNKK